MNNEERVNERLYIDKTHLGSYYTTWNNDLIFAINYVHQLSSLELLIFMAIAMNYDSSLSRSKDRVRELCAYSYEDLSKKCVASKNGVAKAIKHLLSIELIKEYGERKGRAKTKYAPNVKYLHELLDNYLKPA